MANPSTIGRGTTVRGNVTGEGDLEVDGRVEGSIAVTGDLTIGEAALVRSDVSGRSVVVRGAVAGNVTAAELIVLEAGARVVGDLGAPRIGIRPGALVRGHVSTTGSAPATTRARATASPAHAAPAEPRAQAARSAPTRAPQPMHANAAPAARFHVASPSSPVVRSGAISNDGSSARAASSSAGSGEAARREPAAPTVPSLAPPPPVVPALKKGTRASLKRKGSSR